MPASEQSKRLITSGFLALLVMEVINFVASTFVVRIFGYGIMTSLNQILRILDPVCTTIIVVGFLTLYRWERRPADLVVAVAYMMGFLTYALTSTSLVMTIIVSTIGRLGVLALAWRVWQTQKPLARVLAGCFVIETLARAVFFSVIYAGADMSLASPANLAWGLCAFLATIASYLAVRREFAPMPADELVTPPSEPPATPTTPERSDHMDAASKLTKKKL